MQYLWHWHLFSCLLYLILSLFIFSSWWLGLLIFLTLSLSGLFAWNYYLQFHRIIGGFRIRNLIKQKNKEFILSEKKSYRIG